MALEPKKILIRTKMRHTKRSTNEFSYLRVRLEKQGDIV